jgi:hypothetical protein
MPSVAQQGIQDGHLAPLGQSFMSHYNLGSQNATHLNSVGSTLTNTSWKLQVIKRAEIIAPPFNLDGNLNTFSHDELERIQYI